MKLDQRIFPDFTPRRAFLSDLGLGFTGLALGATLFNDGVAKAASPAQPKFSPADGRPHFTPKAKSVISTPH